MDKQKREERKQARKDAALAKADERAGIRGAMLQLHPEKTAAEATAEAISKDVNVSYGDIEKAQTLMDALRKTESKITSDIKSNLQIKSATPIETGATLGSEVQAQPTISMPLKKVATLETTAGSDLTVSEPDGRAISEIVAQTPGKRPGYEETATIDDVKRDIDEMMRKELGKAPSLTLDRLGVTDYYPNIGQDIAVGTYSGRYMGSATIFAAPGAVLPLELYNERRRALARAAQQKQAGIDKILSLGNAPEQFDEQYKQFAYDKLHGLLEKHNWDPQAFYRDKEAMSEMYRIEAIRREMINVDNIVDELEKSAVGKDGETGTYLPPAVADFIYKYKSAKIDNFEDILSGKEDLSQYLDGLRSWSSGTKWADGMLSKWTENPTELPINLKTGKPLNQDNIKEIKDALAKVKSGSGYDQWQTVKKKYFSLDIEAAVNNWMDERLYDPNDPARGWVKEYIEAQIPDESFIQAIERQANDDFEYWNARFQRANELEDRRTYYQSLYEDSFNNGLNQNMIDAQNQIAALDSDPQYQNNKEAKEKRKQEILAEALRKTGWQTHTDQWRQNTAYGIQMVNKEFATANPIEVASQEAKMKIQKWDDAGKKWVTDYVPISEIARKGYNRDTDKSTNKMYKLNAEQEKVFNDITQSGSVRVAASSTEIYPAFYSNGQRYNVTTDRLSAYNSASQKTVNVVAVGNPVIYKESEEKDAEGKPIMKPMRTDVELKFDNDIGTDQGRALLDVSIGKGLQGVHGGTRSGSYSQR